MTDGNQRLEAFRKLTRCLARLDDGADLSHLASGEGPVVYILACIYDLEVDWPPSHDLAAEVDLIARARQKVEELRGVHE